MFGAKKSVEQRRRELKTFLNQKGLKEIQKGDNEDSILLSYGGVDRIQVTLMEDYPEEVSFNWYAGIEGLSREEVLEYANSLNSNSTDCKFFIEFDGNMNVYADFTYPENLLFDFIYTKLQEIAAIIKEAFL